MSGRTAGIGRLTLTVAFAGACWCAPLGAQRGEPKSFEVASVREVVSQAGRSPARFRVIPSGRFEALNVPLRMLILYAFGANGYELEGDPAWLRSARFDIVANAGTSVDERVAKILLQDLLATRFSLVTRREPRRVQAYALTVAKPGKLGPGMRPTTFRDCDTERVSAALRDEVQGSLLTAGHDPCVGFVGFDDNALRAMGGDMDYVVSRLSAITGRPVLDRTKLPGRYDISARWALDHPADTGPSLETALQEQLGLKLKPEMTTLQMLVIDGVQRPTPN